MTANSGLPIVNPEDMSRVWHFAIQAMPDEDDIELALEYLEELALLGEGGLCLNCPVCTYPNCGFGKGW